VKEVCREHEIAETLYYSWRDKLFEGGREALAGKEERQGEKELRRKIRELERALGRKTYELEIAGEEGLGVRTRVARSRAGRPRLRLGGRDACAAGQPPGRVPDADTADSAAAAAAGGPDRAGDRRGRRAEAKRRLSDGRRR
jgi:transposase-like protein